MSEWYAQLFGVKEANDYAAAQANFRFDRRSGTLTSLANGQSFPTGTFETPTLDRLRAEGRAAIGRSPPSPAATTPFVYRHVAQGDVLAEHAKHPGALFQAASQFNCLEFPSAAGTPEDGVTAYAFDRTQGPACSLACAAGTVVRNYFAEVPAAAAAAADDDADEPPSAKKKKVAAAAGQRADRQLNNLDLVEAALGNAQEKYFQVRNGYVFATSPDDLDRLAAAIQRAKEEGGGGGGPTYEALKGMLKIGLHRDVGVTFSDRYQSAPPGIAVTQAYCSALSCAYSRGIPVARWEPLARLVLEAAYEATLWAAVLNALRRPPVSAEITPAFSSNQNKVFLTFLGGGAFGNDLRWICDSIGRAMAVVSMARAPIEVIVAHYRRIDPRVHNWINEAYLLASSHHDV